MELVADVTVDGGPEEAVERAGPCVHGRSLISLPFEPRQSSSALSMFWIPPSPSLSVMSGPFKSSVVLPFDRFVRGITMTGVCGLAVASLPKPLAPSGPRESAALRWFIKSLHTNLLHDQFIFLWIALEILCDMSEVSVELSYVARCQHEIATCPTCKTPTSKQVRGPTLQRFLVESGAVDEPDAKRLGR